MKQVDLLHTGSFLGRCHHIHGEALSVYTKMAKGRPATLRMAVAQIEDYLRAMGEGQNSQ